MRSAITPYRHDINKLLARKYGKLGFRIVYGAMGWSVSYKGRQLGGSRMMCRPPQEFVVDNEREFLECAMSTIRSFRRCNHFPVPDEALFKKLVDEVESRSLTTYQPPEMSAEATHVTMQLLPGKMPPIEPGPLLISPCWRCFRVPRGMPEAWVRLRWRFVCCVTHHCPESATTFMEAISSYNEYNYGMIRRNWGGSFMVIDRAGHHMVCNSCNRVFRQSLVNDQTGSPRWHFRCGCRGYSIPTSQLNAASEAAWYFISGNQHFFLTPDQYHELMQPARA